MTSSSGRLADVGDVGWYCLPRVRVNVSKRLCLGHSFQKTPCSARNPTEEIESCGEKCANLCRVYKLIMIRRVPGYGQLEYLEVNYWLISSLYLINELGYYYYSVILGVELEEPSQ